MLSCEASENTVIRNCNSLWKGNVICFNCVFDKHTILLSSISDKNTEVASKVPIHNNAWPFRLIDTNQPTGLLPKDKRSTSSNWLVEIPVIIVASSLVAVVALARLKQSCFSAAVYCHATMLSSNDRKHINRSLHHTLQCNFHMPTVSRAVYLIVKKLEF